MHSNKSNRLFNNRVLRNYANTYNNNRSGNSNQGYYNKFRSKRANIFQRKTTLITPDIITSITIIITTIITEIPNLEITIIEIEIKEEYMLFRNRETKETPCNPQGQISTMMEGN